MRALRFILALAIASALAPASDAGWPSSGRVYPQPSGGGCTQATTFLARTSGLNGTQTTAYTTLICGMVTDGTWSLMDGLYVFATNTTTTANLNLVSTSYGLTKIGTVTFSANNGYTSDGSTGYFTTGFNPSTAGGHQSTNSASVGACDLTLRGLSGAEESAIGGGNSYLTYVVPGNAVASGTAFGINNNTETSTSATSQGSWITSVTSSSQGYTANNGSSSPFSASSNALADEALYILAFNDAGTADSFSSDQIGYIFFGAGLTTTQITAVYNRLHTYLTAIGAASGC